MGELKAVARGLYEGMGAGGDLDATLERYTADDFVEHEEVPPGIEGSGRDIPRQMFAMVRGAFPDFRVEVHDLVEEGDRVAARVDFVGTHQGEFMGIPASGTQVRIPVFDLFEMRDGKIAAHWGVMDMAGLMAQIGAGGA
jgi:steroid delta-isomerase-like uncharacterized protein